MKDSMCAERLLSLQSYLNNLMLLSDTAQREVMLKCLSSAVKSLKKGLTIEFRKELKELKGETLVG